MRESVRWSTAFHEAGYAVVAWRRGLKVHSATIVPTPEMHGRVEHANPLRAVHLEWDGSGHARRRAEAAIVVSLAGPEAQRRFSPRSWRSSHGGSDHANAADLALAVSTSEDAANAYLRWRELVTRDEVAASSDVIERVARALFERRTLNAAEIVACCRPPPR